MKKNLLVFILILITIVIYNFVSVFSNKIEVLYEGFTNETTNTETANTNTTTNTTTNTDTVNIAVSNENTNTNTNTNANSATENKSNNIQSSYTYGLLITCYDRPEYIEKTFNSLANSTISNMFICIVNDHSTDENANSLINNFLLEKENVYLHKIYNDTNEGIIKSLVKGFQELYDRNCEYMINLDSDVELKPEWLERLHEVYDLGKEEYGSDSCLVSGFNCVDSCTHKIVASYDSFYEKNTVGGINIFFNRDKWEGIRLAINNSIKGKNHGWDWGVCEFCRNNEIPILVTRPSVVQHIGIDGVNSTNNRVDIAEDF